MVDVLLAAGVLTVVGSSLAAALTRDARDRLHLLTPVTAVGAPLVAAALGVQDGFSLWTGSVALVAVLLVGTGPVVVTAVAQVIALQEGPDRSWGPSR